MNITSKIYVAGHTGLVGSALIRKLIKYGYTNIITKTHKELDLINQQDVDNFFNTEKPEYVFLSAAMVGGILANNTYKADFIYNNLMIESNVLFSSYKHNVEKLIFLGSSCIYPKNCSQPIKEEYLLTGELESTNEPYAVSKIAGIKLCESFNYQYNTKFIPVMPTNLYGINDNFDLQNSHVLPALIRKIHEAKCNNTNVTIWGDGSALREFLYVDDLADALIFIMEKYNDTSIINIGTGKEISIKNLVHMISYIINYDCEIIFDTTKPNGTLRKILDVTKLTNLGWNCTTDIITGIEQTYTWFKNNYNTIRGK
jgi:GDP-L-fucose synthase